MGEPVTGRPVGQRGLAQVTGVGLGDRPGLDRGERTPGLARPAPRSRPGRRRSGASTRSQSRSRTSATMPREHSRGAGLGVEVRDRHGYIESEPTDTQTGYPQQYRAFFSEKKMRISGPLILHRHTRTRRRRPGTKPATPSLQPRTATTHGPSRCRRSGQGGFETLAELAPQPPTTQSSLLNHRANRARSSTTERPAGQAGSRRRRPGTNPVGPSLQPRTATTRDRDGADVLVRGGFETLAELAPQPPRAELGPQPPGEPSSLLSHRELITDARSRVAG